MTKIKFNLTLDDLCTLTLQENSGYFSSTNPNGFVLETDLNIPTDYYKLSNGYFKTVVLYSKYGTTPIVVNPTNPFYKVENIKPDYLANFLPERFKFTQDGVFTIKRIFVISKEFYLAEKDTGRFTGKDIYYTDGEVISRVTPEGTYVVSLNDFLSVQTPIVGVVGSIKFVSTCFINQCYFDIIRTLINSGLEVCSTSASNALIEQRDFLYMVLEAVKYLKEIGNTVEIQRIIESAYTCGGICKEVATRDCGCNG